MAEMDEKRMAEMKEKMMAAGMDEARLAEMKKKMMAAGMDEARLAEMKKKMMAAGMDEARLAEMKKKMMAAGMGGPQSAEPKAETSEAEAKEKPPAAEKKEPQAGEPKEKAAATDVDEARLAAMKQKMREAGMDEARIAQIEEKIRASGMPPIGEMTPDMKKSMAKKMKTMNFKASIGNLVRYMKRYMPLIILAAILSVTGTILNLIGPGKLSDMTKLIQQGMNSTIDVSAVVKIAVTLLILYGFGFLFSYVQAQILAVVTQRASKGVREKISVKINKLPLRYFDRTATGDMLSRVTNDVDSLSQALNQSLGTLVSAVTMFVGSLIMMFYTNWIMAAAGVASTLIGFAFMSAIVKKSQKYFLMQQYGLGALNGHIEESYTGHSVIKAYNGEKKAKGHFGTMNQKLYDSAWKSQFFSGLMPPFMIFVGNLGYVVVCVVGAVLTMNKIIGFEVIVAFMLYIRLFTQPLTQFAQSANSLQSAAAASDRVFRFLGEEEMEDEHEKKEKLEHVSGDVEFDHVRFGYEEGKTIIHDFSATIKAGQKVAIVGPTGAGKTTMVNLLMRFYELNAGAIRIDGVPLDKLTRENIHDLFCMVLQDTWLFEGTIKENVRYSKTDRSDEEVIAACKAVGLHRFIETLPQGYDTVLSDSAALSAGQRQLVTIARAMVENAPMLILDEATSSVDTRTEALIQRAMDQLMKGRTSFVIAHRLSTIKNADMILVMKDGDIIESGNHEELMKKGGFYADLYNSQFEFSAA